MRATFFFITAILISACATEPYPAKRPLTLSAMSELGATDVAIVESNDSIKASWLAVDSSATGAQYGLIGALTSAVMDAIINAGPSRRAHRVAEETFETIQPDYLTSSLKQAFERIEVDQDNAQTVYFADISDRQPVTEPNRRLDTVNVETSYMLAENASAFSVTAKVTIDRTDIDYVTPYVFEKSVPKEQLKGDIYSNSFSYFSKSFIVPTLNEELKAKLIIAIEDSYRDAEGNLPLPDSKEGKELAKDLENGRDNKLTKSEASIFMVNNWTANNGAELKAELDQAHDFIAKYVLLDLNSDIIPDVEGEDEILDTAEDGRVVMRMGSGSAAGSYSSRTGGPLNFVTYGNAQAVASSARERTKKLKFKEDSTS